MLNGPVVIYRRRGVRGGEDLGLNKVKFFLAPADTPYECYFTEVIPLTTFDDFRNPPPRLHFLSKFE